jgi:hypothetical protein
MKIGCDACGRAEATVLCCADEAALCGRCDTAVHSANKLAGRHHRVALLPPYAPDVVVEDSEEEGHPLCDICQVRTQHKPLYELSSIDLKQVANEEAAAEPTSVLR